MKQRFAESTVLFDNIPGPVIASLVFRFGHRPVMMAGALLSAFGIFLSAFATSVYMLIVLIGIVGGEWITKTGA